VAAAIFVITQEDIRSSSALNIPDLLRMVPGLDVARINANTWAISSRGFTLQFANKLLVLIDGRAVYTPLFGGVNWDTQSEFLRTSVNPFLIRFHRQTPRPHENTEEPGWD
jgi:iron complex outermembrane receptor protein